MSVNKLKIQSEYIMFCYRKIISIELSKLTRDKCLWNTTYATERPAGLVTINIMTENNLNVTKCYFRTPNVMHTCKT